MQNARINDAFMHLACCVASIRILHLNTTTSCKTKVNTMTQIQSFAEICMLRPSSYFFTHEVEQHITHQNIPNAFNKC